MLSPSCIFQTTTLFRATCARFSSSSTAATRLNPEGIIIVNSIVSHHTGIGWQIVSRASIARPSQRPLRYLMKPGVAHRNVIVIAGRVTSDSASPGYELFPAIQDELERRLLRPMRRFHVLDD